MSDSPVSEGFQKVKAWYQSKTIIGVIIAALGAILNAVKPEWGFDLPGTVDAVMEGAEQISTSADVGWGTILQIWGIVQAIIGRFKAKDTIAV